MPQSNNAQERTLFPAIHLQAQAFRWNFSASTIYSPYNNVPYTYNLIEIEYLSHFVFKQGSQVIKISIQSFLPTIINVYLKKNRPFSSFISNLTSSFFNVIMIVFIDNIYEKVAKIITNWGI